MKIHVSLSSKDLVPIKQILPDQNLTYNQSPLSITQEVESGLTLKDILKSYPVAGRGAVKTVKDFTSTIISGSKSEFVNDKIRSILHKSIAPASLNFLGIFFELLEDHDISYVDDSTIEEAVQAYKKIGYSGSSLLQTAPEGIPLSAEFIPFKKDYYYCFDYDREDQKYTIAINRLPKGHHSYSSTIESGLFAQLELLLKDIELHANLPVSSSLISRSAPRGTFDLVTAELSLSDYAVISIKGDVISTILSRYIEGKFVLPYLEQLISSGVDHTFFSATIFRASPSSNPYYKKISNSFDIEAAFAGVITEDHPNKAFTIFFQDKVDFKLRDKILDIELGKERKPTIPFVVITLLKDPEVVDILAEFNDFLQKARTVIYSNIQKSLTVFNKHFKDVLVPSSKLKHLGVGLFTKNEDLSIAIAPTFEDVKNRLKSDNSALLWLDASEYITNPRGFLLDCVLMHRKQKSKLVDIHYLYRQIEAITAFSLEPNIFNYLVDLNVVIKKD
jgi:hypothetical protein